MSYIRQKARRLFLTMQSVSENWSNPLKNTELEFGELKCFGILVSGILKDSISIDTHNRTGQIASCYDIIMDVTHIFSYKNSSLCLPMTLNNTFRPRNMVTFAHIVSWHL